MFVVPDEDNIFNCNYDETDLHPDKCHWYVQNLLNSVRHSRLYDVVHEDHTEPCNQHQLDRAED
jgi:hypothetical protein